MHHQANCKPSDSAHRDVAPVAQQLAAALELRQKYVYQREVPEWEDERLAAFNAAARSRPFAPVWAEPPTKVSDPQGAVVEIGAAQIDLSEVDAARTMQTSEYTFSIGADGVAVVSDGSGPMDAWKPPTLEQFTRDLEWLYMDVCSGKVSASRLRKCQSEPHCDWLLRLVICDRALDPVAVEPNICV